MLVSGHSPIVATWSRALGDVSFELDGRNYTFEQPLPRRLQAAFRHAVDNASQLADVERIQVTLQDATSCIFTIAATPAVVSALRARRRPVASAGV